METSAYGDMYYGTPFETNVDMSFEIFVRQLATPPALPAFLAPIPRGLLRAGGAMQTSPKIFCREPGLAASRIGDVLVSVWSEPASMRTLQSMRAACDAMITEAPSGWATLTLLTMPKGRPLGAEERAASDKLNADYAKYKVADAIVVEQGGLVGASIRAIIATVNLVNRSKYPSKVFDRLGDASGWIAGYIRATDALVLERTAREMTNSRT